MIEIGIAGKPNAGKSTFFKSATLADAEIANYPFTTIKPNIGVGSVRVRCVCEELGVNCGKCIDGWRFIPVKLIDVAGLVPDAHKGRGLGNEFLDDLRQSEAIIHVVDASGSTDENGNEIGIGERDPVEDVKFLLKEIDMWIFGILKKNWEKVVRKAKAERKDYAKFVLESLSGLGFEEAMIREAFKGHEDIQKIDDEKLKMIAKELREKRFKMIISANKADKAPKELLEKLKKFDSSAVPTSANYELTLRTAVKAGYIKYLPGDSDFKILKELNEKQKKALEKIRDYLNDFKSTGVQDTINKLVFDVLGYIVVYPVEDERKFTDSKGNILPDAFLVKKGTTARELAYKIHTEIGKGFIYGMDARKKIRIAEDHELKNNDVIKIVSSA
ncbi:MAG: redox-regulated ATPase YchF [Archaeoglobaceae archaeon]|nr:redox-regulated ATPase YchF [Archaeoglobaceae archaeon]MDW8128512.1 redox-regulated ATPase YchF [Archaeoglobaceae archaeon]